MNGEKTYEALLQHLKQTGALEQVAQLISWDQEAMMPPGGAEGRAEQSAALAAVVHGRRTDARIGEWLDAIDDAGLGDVAAVNVREARRGFERASRIPVKLAEELARLSGSAKSWSFSCVVYADHCSTD